MWIADRWKDYQVLDTSLGEKLEELRERHEQGLLTSIEFPPLSLSYQFDNSLSFSY